MSQGNVELVRSIYAAWKCGDFSSAEWAHPEIEFVVPDGPDPGTWKGLAEMTESWRSQVSAWEAFDAVADEFRQLDDERVLVLSHFRGRGKTSGLEVGQKGAELFHIRDGERARRRGIDRDRRSEHRGHSVFAAVGTATLRKTGSQRWT